MSINIEKFFGNIIKKELHTPEGKFNLTFGILLGLCFVVLEVFEGLKKIVWKLLFNTVPESDAVKLFYGLITYGVVCIMIITLAEQYKKRKI